MDQHLFRLTGMAGDVLGIGCARERWPVEAIEPDRLPRIEWRGCSGFNPQFSGYTAGHYSSGFPEQGWVLYTRGTCWEQRTKPELPPEPGMIPERIKGVWRWVKPQQWKGGICESELG